MNLSISTNILPAPKMRELVFLLLFSFDQAGAPERETIPLLMQELAVSRRHVQEAFSKALEIWHICASLDGQITAQTRDYAFERIGPVEKNVLRLALYEFCVEKILALEVILAEGMRLTRKFSQPESVAYVHAVLAGILSPAVQVDLQEPLQAVEPTAS